MNVLVLDDIHPIFITEMKQAGFTVAVNLKLNTTELECCIKDYEVLVVNSKTIVSKVLIDKAVKLKAIGRPGSGMENIDVDHAQQKGIACFNSPEGNADAVAEHAIGMLLTLCRRIASSNAEMKKGIWKRAENTGVELGNKVIGIIGYGHTGSALAKKLQGFGMRVLAYDKYKMGFNSPIVEECSLAEIQKHATFLSINLPLTDETKNVIDKPFLEQFSNPFVLVNTSRGAIVDLQAVVDLIKVNKIQGACLDVYPKEPFEAMKLEQEQLFIELKNNDRILTTPHIAGWTSEAKFKMAKILADRLKFFLIIN